MGKPTKKTDLKKKWAQGKRKKRAYAVENRSINKLFYIVCEGEVTEPEYFKSFRLTSAKVESYGLGESKTRLVESTIDIKENESDDYEFWCVFDMDIVPSDSSQKQDFNNAVHLAEKNDIKVAYSNDCFELWFVLHLKVVEQQFLRKKYYEDLGNFFDCNYEKQGKNRVFAQKIYDELQKAPANQAEAIKRAQKLWDKFELENTPPADRNPCTNVHHLVKELNEYLID